MAEFLEGKAVSKLIDGISVESAEMDIVNAAAAIFNVEGLVYLHSIVGRVTTTVAAGACTLKLQHNSDAAAVSDMSDTHANIANHTEDEIFYTITGTPADDLVASDQILSAQAAGYILPTGDIEQVTTEDQDGGIVWTAFYTPITPGANISAA